MANDFSQSAAEAANTAVASAQHVSTTLSHEFKNFVADVEDFLKASALLSSAELTKAKAQIAARVDTAKAQIDAVTQTITDRAQRAASVTNTYVKEEPWKAVGIGAAAGLLVGVLIARRR